MQYRLAQKNTHTVKIKGSKFIAICQPIRNREEAKAAITDVEKEHHKANHVCWAYRVYEENQILGYSSDAGEPHASAGPPILAALEGRRLVNAVCVVVRYFGGTKLGIGGLIRAYGGTAAGALDEAGLQPYDPPVLIRLATDNAGYADLMRILGKYQYHLDQSYRDNQILLEVRLPCEEVPSFHNDLQTIPQVQVL